MVSTGYAYSMMELAVPEICGDIVHALSIHLLGSVPYPHRIDFIDISCRRSLEPLYHKHAVLAMIV